MGRKQRNARRSQVRHNKSSSSTRAIRDLQYTTQQVVPPQRPDIERMRLNHRQLYTFERSFSGNFTTAGINYSTFQLNSFPGVTEFTTLFTRYRFLQIVVEFPEPMSGLTTGYAKSSALDPMGVYASAPPSGESDIQQFDTWMAHPLPGATMTVTRVWSPHKVPSTTGGVTPARWWESTDVPTINYCALISFIVAGSSSTSVPYRVHAVLQFSNPY